MESRIQILLIAFTIGLFVLILELVRRRHLLERYAMLWLFAAAVLVGLAIWRNLLEVAAKAIGVYYAPSALFVIAFGFVLVLLLHFSVVVSRLTDQSKILSQHVGLLEEETHRLRTALAEREGREGNEA